MNNLAYENKYDEHLGKPKPKVDVEKAKVYTFEEAVLLTGIGRYHYTLQIVGGICLMSAVVEALCVGIIMPFISHDIPATIAEEGFLASAGFLGIVLSSHAVGFLSDTWGRVKMLRSTLMISFITSALSAFSVNIWMLITLRFLTGLIMSACQGCIFSYVGEFHSSRTRARYITMFSMFVPLGMMILPALGMAILPLKLNATVFGMKFGSWRLMLLIISFVRVFAIIGLFMKPESPKYELMQGDYESALKTLRKMFSINMRQPQYDYPVQQLSSEVAGGTLNSITGVKDALNLIWEQTIPLFNKQRILNTTNICVVMFIICLIAQGTFMWFPTILKQHIANIGNSYTICEVMKLSENTSQNITTVVGEPVDVHVDTTMFKILILIGGVLSVSYFLFSMIVNKVGKKNLLFIWILISGCSSLVLIWVNHFGWSVVIFTFITSLNTCVGIVSTVAMEYFPTNVSAMGMCLIMMIARIGSVAGSNTFGLMLYTQCTAMFYTYFVLCVLIASLSLLLP